MSNKPHVVSSVCLAFFADLFLKICDIFLKVLALLPILLLYIRNQLFICRLCSNMLVIDLKDGTFKLLIIGDILYSIEHVGLETLNFCLAKL